MALIKCRECGKEISSRADNCPYCGCPVSNAKKYPQFYEKSTEKINVLNEDINNLNIHKQEASNTYNQNKNQKFCKHCGKLIDKDCVICPKCGKQVENLQNNFVQNNTTKADNINYGKELGLGIKESLKGLNTMASPKKRKTCILMIIIPLAMSIFCIVIGAANIGIVFGFGLGIYQFYIGKFGKGLLFTFTVGMFFIGAIIDLFKLSITNTLRDANGFPIIY